MRQQKLPPELETAELRSADGVSVTILNLGATIASMRIPVGGSSINAVLAYPDLESYRSDPFYLGTTVGRFANRISRARFSLDGNEVKLDANEGSSGNCLHGGSDGLNRPIFRMRNDDGGTRIVCSHMSPHGTSGFPGNLTVDVTYELIEPMSLAIVPLPDT